MKYIQILCLIAAKITLQTQVYAMDNYESPENTIIASEDRDHNKYWKNKIYFKIEHDLPKKENDILLKFESPILQIDENLEEQEFPEISQEYKNKWGNRAKPSEFPK